MKKPILIVGIILLAAAVITASFLFVQINKLNAEIDTLNAKITLLTNELDKAISDAEKAAAEAAEAVAKAEAEAAEAAAKALGEQKAIKKIVIGATPTPHAIILELVEDDLRALGFEIELMIFTDYPLPNPALTHKELDANYFQHMPYLNAYNETVSEAEKLIAAIPVHYEPYGIYPGKTKSLDALPDNAKIAITNDPSNQPRALILLQDAGLITLPEGVTSESALTIFDIVTNLKNIEFYDVEPSTLPSTLDDVDLAIINGNYAIGAGLSPAKDALFLEPAEGATAQIYANYVVVRPEDAESDFVAALKTVLQSDKVKNFMLTYEPFAGGVIPMF